VHVFYFLPETPAVAKEKSGPVLSNLIAKFTKLPALCALSFLLVVSTFVRRLDVKRCPSSTRARRIPKNRKKREIALRSKMSRGAIRQILARESLQQPISQNLAYCVSAPNLFFVFDDNYGFLARRRVDDG
jgi:hypothetical protein